MMTSNTMRKIINMINNNSELSDECIFNSLNMPPGKSHEEVVSILKTIKQIKMMPEIQRNYFL